MVEPTKVEETVNVPVLCVHGDTVFYPTAVVSLQIGSWQRKTRVVVAPQLPVAVLLGQDIGEPRQNKGTQKGLAVVTRAQRQQAKKNTTRSENLRLKEDIEVDNSKRSQVEEDMQTDVSDEDEGMADEDDQEPELQGKSDGEEDQRERDELNATPAELREWQQKDTSLEKVRSVAQEKPGMTED